MNLAQKDIFFCSEIGCNLLFPNVSLHLSHLDSLKFIPMELVKKFGFSQKIDQGTYGPIFNAFDLKNGDAKALRLCMETEFADNFDLLTKINHQNILKYYKKENIKLTYINNIEISAFILMELSETNLNNSSKIKNL